MPSFTYDPTIPIGTHYPGNDRPLMQSNFNSTQGILNVDHYSFDNQTNGGWHKQITFPAANSPSSVTGTASIIYSANGTATTAGVSQLFFKNSQSNFLLNAIKVFCIFTVPNTSNPSFQPGNGFNIDSIASVNTPPSSASTVTITFANSPLASSTSNNNAIVLFAGARVSGSGDPDYTLTSSQITFLGNNNGTYQILILQA
jgi:hypothetical protein